MATPPTNASARVATPLAPLPTGAVFAPGQTQSSQTSANPNPQMQVVGVDSQPFSIVVNPSIPATQTLTFPNLPKRAVQNIPLSGLQATQNSIVVGPNDYLLLTCYVQGAVNSNGASASAVPQAITATGVVTTGPFLGSESFITFQAKVTVVTQQQRQIVKGSVVAHLTLVRG